MIGRLRGILLEKRPPHLLLECGGLAYELEAPMTTFYALPPPGNETVLHTHLAVREDSLRLFGFAREDQRRMFRHLLRVNGVGTRLALAILSRMDTEEFLACVRGSDLAGLTVLPGVGRKTAERLIVELRDRLQDWQPEAPPREGERGRPLADAVSALVALGYGNREAKRCASEVAADGMSSEAIIRAALQRLTDAAAPASRGGLTRR
ncbi:MAG: Holliday junction branch migration protein RuvA [Gammaproteobacteria bacterium]|nr:Holliday junction branch migration protein RuvA [Gammaproteobacteria bacterium]